MQLTFSHANRWLLAALLLIVAQWSIAAPVGQVEFAQGLTSAQQPGQPPRFLGQGDPLQEGDVLSTGARGFAIIAFPDGGKMTLRPNTIFVIDQYRATAGQESVVLRLLKGGLRAITGSVGRSKPEAVRISTPTATIGIRGTEFDARICTDDCAKEGRSSAKPVPAAADQAVARVAALTGTATVTAANKQTRNVLKGAALYTGESIRTAKGAYVVLAFRDETRITVASDSEFRLEDVRFSGAQSDSGSFAVRLLRGTARTLTGLLAKRDPAAFQFRAATATIGIRGSGFDTRVQQECDAGKCTDVVYTWLWLDSIALDAEGRSLLIPLLRAAVFDALRNRFAVLDTVPAFFTNETAPRPDQIPFDETLFKVTDVEGAPPGLYVNVNDEGHILFVGLNNLGIDLGRREAGYQRDGNSTPVRLLRIPLFILNDPIPAPQKFDERLLRLLEILGDSSGGLICEL